MSGAVFVVGSFNVDHAWTTDALPVPGETRSGRYAAGPGGKGFNQAIACARSGAPTHFACALGDDAGGSLARSLSASERIALHVSDSRAPTGSAGIFVDARGRNSIVVAAGANAELHAASVSDALQRIDPPAVLLAQLETPAAAARAAFRDAQATALRMLNPAPADAAASAHLLGCTDVLTPNETECAALAGALLGEDVDAATLATLADAALHALCRRLLPDGTVLLTLGPAGVFVSHGARLRGDASTCYRVPARAVATLDTTGAGDACNGALAASLALAPGRPFREHVGYAVAFAGLSTERAGAAASMPTRAEVLARFPDLAKAG